MSVVPKKYLFEIFWKFWSDLEEMFPNFWPLKLHMCNKTTEPWTLKNDERFGLTGGIKPGRHSLHSFREGFKSILLFVMSSRHHSRCECLFSDDWGIIDNKIDSFRLLDDITYSQNLIVISDSAVQFQRVFCVEATIMTRFWRPWNSVQILS